MRASRIQAVDHVEFQASPEVEEELRWCYGELIGLDELPVVEALPRRLRFRSAHVELRISLIPEPEINPVDERMTFAVPSLPAAEEQLQERKIPFEWIRGLVWTDRRLVFFDPAGNRVALKREWPQVAL